jgi:hypothetical protein
MGLTYGINSSFSESGIADGPFTIGVTIAPENIDLAIDTTLRLVNEFIADGIRADELADEQSSIAGIVQGRPRDQWRHRQPDLEHRTIRSREPTISTASRDR